jgi:hypothetical protein
MYFPKKVEEAIEIAPGELMMPEPVCIIEDPEAGEGTGNDNNAVKEAPEGNVAETPVVTTDDDEEHEERLESEPVLTANTRSGRAIKMPSQLDDYEIGLTAAEECYYDAMSRFDHNLEAEVCCVGVGIGGGFTNTNELHVMKYDEAMATKDVEQWHDTVEEEHQRMEKHVVFKAVPEEEMIPEDATVLTSTWVMKKKANGTFRARLNARGFEQIDREHFNSDMIRQHQLYLR